MTLALGKEIARISRVPRDSEDVFGRLVEYTIMDDGVILWRLSWRYVRWDRFDRRPQAESTVPGSTGWVVYSMAHRDRVRRSPLAFVRWWAKKVGGRVDIQAREE